MSIDFNDKIVCFESVKCDDEWLNAIDENDDFIPNRVLHTRYTREEVFQNLNCLWKIKAENDGYVTIENMEYREYYLYASDRRKKQKFYMSLKKLPFKERGRWKIESFEQDSTATERKDQYYIRSPHNNHVVQPHKSGLAMHGSSKKEKNTWLLHPIQVCKNRVLLKEVTNLTSEKLRISITSKVGVFNTHGESIVANEQLACAINKVFQELDTCISFAISQLEGKAVKCSEQYRDIQPKRKLTVFQLTGFYGPYVIKTNSIDCKIEDIE
ncbi:DgyrCDS2867 [Dimorphilus gyrociliatus]|uniref:DgyrCDS2867 n=1 Tax=Dimorphilus gyrociliatus TaxID=2664684 RepID=A0A7I8VBJ4_9ANNE|nr:DgyrCDS2867 [Dimorphilus gyrociliatus]